ncbi:MAG: amidohydrolase family protein [Pseudomonadota bacterium]
MHCSVRALKALTTAALACALASAAHAHADSEGPVTAGQPAAKGLAAPTLAIEHARWFDGQRFVPGTWYVVDGKFTRRSPARIDLRVDGRGRYAIAPYADAHNHNLQGSWMATRQAAAMVRDGVFYSAQLCANPAHTAEFRGLMGQAGLPDVLYATACLSASDGHPLGLFMHLAQQAGQAEPDVAEGRRMYVPVDDAAQLAGAWPGVLAGRPDFIKVILVDSAHHAERKGRPELMGDNGLDPALLPEVVQRARAAKLRVVAHADTAADLKAAVDAGADLIAHLPGYHFDKRLTPADYRLDDATIALMARRGVPLVATASVPVTMVGLKGEALAAVQALQRDNLQRLLKAGVRVLIGSDNPFGGPLDEVAYLDAMQLMPRAELLDTLTRHTPRALFPGRAIGGFEEGAEASLLLLDGDPLQDLGALRRIRLRVKQGSVLAF